MYAFDDFTLRMKFRDFCVRIGLLTISDSTGYDRMTKTWFEKFQNHAKTTYNRCSY